MATVIALGALGVVVMWWHDTTPSSVVGVGNWLSAVGRVTGLVGTYLVVIEVLLMGRVAWLDRWIGMDRLALWHRRNGEYSISLLFAHAIFIIWGYAVTAHAGLARETKVVVLDYPDMLAATVGLLLLGVIGVLSARVVRRHVDYQTWYFIHLYTYVALALSFAHQFATGADFATHPLNRAVWIALYAAVGTLLVVYRVAKPLRDGYRHRLEVAQVIDEAPGISSIYIRGKRLGELQAAAGQFFLWRFLTRSGWWQAHPYSLSAAPNGSTLRLTVKHLGDHSTGLAELSTGTRVLAEGPYGSFTARRRTRRKVLLIGAGVGITPLRALFESLPSRPGEMSLIYRVHQVEDLAFRRELDAIAAAKKATVHYLVGSRRDHPEYLTPRHLRALVPDIAQRDVFVCGPNEMTVATTAALRRLRVPTSHIHTEHFEL